MDITQFVVSSRDKVDLQTDYSGYRTRLGHRLLKCRQKLHVAARHRGKYNHKSSTVQPEQVAEDITYAHLLILSAERAHAQAVAMKTVQSANGKNMNNNARSHIVSRFDKAAKYAEALLAVLQADASGATAGDRLEARAYAASLRGAADLERRSWPRSLASYAAAWAIYSALSAAAATAGRPAVADLFGDRVVENEQWVRYAAYQLKKPRSTPIPMIVRQALARDRTGLAATIHQISPAVLQPATATDDALLADSTAPLVAPVASTRTLTWRAREVRIEDAPIASAWAALDLAKARLRAVLVAGAARPASPMSPGEQAAAYDDVLTASQDAVDATKAAIDDLRAEGLPQSDPAVQLLYVARTAANYEMISYRIGRNRVLTGPHDGAVVHLNHAAKHRNTKKSKSKTTTTATANSKTPIARPEAPGRFLARLKEKVVLYDGVLQSLESVKELPGVAADAELSEQLDATAKYFTALKSLAISRSHDIAGSAANALALAKHGHDQCAEAAPALAKAEGTASPPPEAQSPLRTILVSTADVEFLLALLQNEVQRSRALVDIETLQQAATKATTTTTAPTLSERLTVYPLQPVDLDNIVAYPPRLEPVPVKPIFLDIAWNYIEYPGKTSAATAAKAPATAGQTASGAQQQEQPQQQKRGWFGFGR